MSRFSCASLILLLALAAVLGCPVSAMHAERPFFSAPYDAPGWAAMPEGSRFVFVGVHGGTAAVSLFPANDNAPRAVPGGNGRDFSSLVRMADRTQSAAAAARATAFWLHQFRSSADDAELFAAETSDRLSSGSSH